MNATQSKDIKTNLEQDRMSQDTNLDRMFKYSLIQASGINFDKNVSLFDWFIEGLVIR